MSRPAMDPDHPEYSNDDPTVARAQELAQVEAEIQMISAERDAMSQDNGFVERPDYQRPRTGAFRPGSVMARLRETADNGKAIVIIGGHGGVDYTAMRRQGLRLHCIKQSDGTYLAWCERIDAASGASRPEGARP